MERTCNNCKRIGTKWCNKCVSTAQKQYSKFEPNKTWLDSIFKECMDLEKAMSELRDEKIIIPTQEEEKNMEYKTKEELQLSIEKMETELAKMREALNKEEEEDIFWKPAIRSPYYFIDSSFYSAYTWMGDDCCSKSRAKYFNCFETSEECQEAAQDMKTLFMLYRLSRKSMAREGDKNPTYYITANAKIGRVYNAGCSKELFHFASALEAQKAIEIIGEENLIELFKKF